MVAGADGGSKGFGFVVFKRKADAERAIANYNGVPLDGRPLQIKIAQGGAGGAGAVQVVASSAKRTVIVAGGGRGRGRGRGIAARGAGRARGGGRGGGRGRGRGRGKSDGPKSMEDLDKELEAYTASK